MTFAFLTANGNQGVLQITGLFTNDPRGMKLRYKLTQLASGGGGGSVTVSSPDLRDLDADAIRINVPNRYLAAALAGMDIAAEKIKAAAARGELSEQTDVFNHFNELCDQLQGKNQNAAFTPQDWGFQDADKFKTITNSLAALEDASERMRDIARSNRRSEAEREAILKAEANKFVNRYAEFKAQLHLATQSGGMGAAGQNPQRKFVRLVVEKTAMTFEGQPTSWENVGALLAKVPDRNKTVLEFAVTSDQITVAEQNEWFHKADALARQHGFEYASFIGIHPAGSKGTVASSARPVLPIAQAKPGEYRVALTNGITVEVVALTSTPRAGLAWWQPNGTLLAESPGDRLGELSGLCPSGKSSVELAVLFKESGNAATERVLLFEPLPLYVNSTELFNGDQFAGEAALIGYRATPGNLTCKLGVADGPAERVATWDGAGTLLSNETGGPLQLVRSGADGESCFKLQHRVDPARFNVRIAARLKNGEHKLARVCRVEYGGTQEARLCALILDLQDSDVVFAYELYRVPLRWMIIAGIATKPTVAPVRANVEASTN